MTYEKVKETIEREAGGPPAKRTQPVPCAYCARGGNGDKSCSCGFTYTKYSKYNDASAENCSRRSLEVLRECRRI